MRLLSLGGFAGPPPSIVPAPLTSVPVMYKVADGAEAPSLLVRVADTHIVYAGGGGSNLSAEKQQGRDVRDNRPFPHSMMTVLKLPPRK